MGQYVPLCVFIIAYFVKSTYLCYSSFQTCGRPQRFPMAASGWPLPQQFLQFLMAFKHKSSCAAVCSFGAHWWQVYVRFM